MSNLAALTLSLVLLLVAFPLISLGTWNDNPALWWAGLLALAAGGLLLPLRRFIGRLRADPPTAVGLCEDERVS